MAVRARVRRRTSIQVNDLVRVAAAVIFGADGRVLLAQRPNGKPYAGYWEFPGGKLEPGEGAAAALARELHEELGIVVKRASPWIVQEFVYPHAHVELDFFRVFEWSGVPTGHDGQALAWQTPGAFDVAPLLPANTRVMAALSLPPIYGITCAEDLGEDEFIRRAERAFAQGLRLVQLREKNWSMARRDAFAARLLPLATRFGVRVLLNGSPSDARRRGFAGAHWTAAALEQATSRPDDLLVGASCHSPQELERAIELDVDFALVGPVRATPTHPHAQPLTFEGFESLIRGTRVPVYAIGGLTPDDLRAAIGCGAHGIALRRFAWPVT
jgi:8-oxo-dGTP diphosphatase